MIDDNGRNKKAYGLIYALNQDVISILGEINKLSTLLQMKQNTTPNKFFFWKRNIDIKALNNQKILLTKLKDIETWLRNYPSKW